MPTELVNLLVQLPFLAVFIWYVTRRDEREITRWERQQEQFTGTLERRQQMIDKLADVVHANTQAMLTLKQCLDVQGAELRDTEQPLRTILDHTTHMRQKLEAHHDYVVQKHEGR